MSQNLPRIAICGHGRSGKDTAARWLAEHTPLRLGKTTSEVIAPYRAAELGVSVEEAFTRRHEERDLWYELGNRLRANDWARLVRETLRDGEICVGIRDPEELAAARAEGLVDLVLWIDRDVKPDSTMKFGPERCDIIVQEPRNAWRVLQAAGGAGAVRGSFEEGG